MRLAGQPEATIGGPPVCSDDAEAMRLYACNGILNAALARVRSHWLLHGAALVSPEGRGVILAGAAGLGKSTLTLALLERGWGFLSDDVAAVGRADGLLYPFPRSLGLRRPGGPPGEKEARPAEAVASPCPTAFLFLLSEGKSAGGGPWFIVLDRLTDSLVAELRAVPGVLSAAVARTGAFPAVRLEVAPGTLPAAEPAVEAACRRGGVLLFELVQGREAPPDFSGKPRLEPLTAAEAARALLPHVKGGVRSALVREELGGSPARLFLALGEVTGRMRCCRLEVGRLAEMVGMIVDGVSG